MFGRVRIPIFGEKKMENMEIQKNARKKYLKCRKKKSFDKNGPYYIILHPITPL